LWINDKEFDFQILKVFQYPMEFAKEELSRTYRDLSKDEK
jgi:isoleucyl-tRNA synthetase